MYRAPPKNYTVFSLEYLTDANLYSRHQVCTPNKITANNILQYALVCQTA